jgi:hypothetical protein
VDRSCQREKDERVHITCVDVVFERRVHSFGASTNSGRAKAGSWSSSRSLLDATVSWLCYGPLGLPVAPESEMFHVLGTKVPRAGRH